MAQIALSRRRLMLGGATALVALAAPAAFAAAPTIHVVKDPNCGCCTAWVDILKANGFDVTVEAMPNARLVRYKLENGIPQQMMSCHTGRIEGYMVEGHVPVDDIQRLLNERPRAIGLAVPGMPYGSPGMGPESQREAFQVFLIRPDGSTQVFSDYPAA